MRRRLTLLVAATMSLVLIAFLVPLGLLLRSVAEDRTVQSANIAAQYLGALAATTDRESLAVAVAQVNASGQRVTVFLPDDRSLGIDAPRTPAVELAARGSSLTVEAAGGRAVLYFTRDANGGATVIQAFITTEDLRHGVARAWLILAGLGVVLLGIGLFVADRLARSIVRPIASLAATSHQLAAGDLDARADGRDGPGEVREVATALNHLAERIRVLLREEVEAVADLSHRLRTPLTSLRLDTETLDDPRDVARISAHADALERAVTQIILDSRARASHAGEASGPAPTCDAAEVVRERVEFWSVLAEDTGRDVQVSVPGEAHLVRLSRPELVACVDALLGNVFAHTPDGTAFAVRLGRTAAGDVRLVIADDGSGFPAASGHRVLERGASSAGSTGLGLDIARRSAVGSGGSLVLERSPRGGAQVVVELGAAPP